MPRSNGSDVRKWTDAAATGDLAEIIRLHDSGILECTSSAMDLAAGNGHLGVVQFLHEIGKECTTDALDAAAAEGHVEIVEFLLDVGTTGCTTWAMDDAAAEGHLDIVKILHATGKQCTVRAVDGAAMNGFLDMVVWLCAHRDEGWTQTAVDGALAGGYFDVLRVLEHPTVFR